MRMIPDFALGFEKNGLTPCQYKACGLGYRKPNHCPLTCEQKNRSRIRCNTARRICRAERSSGKELETCLPDRQAFCQNPNANSGIILGLTPARGGSKGIPGKNIKMIAGKPLIAWTIEAAKQAAMLNKYVVSTEDEEIARIAKEYAGEIIYRPAALAADEAATISVLQHAVACIPCDIVVLLQATSPIRRPGLIDECIKDFLDNEYDSLATGFICKYTEYSNNDLRRQDIKGFFCDGGNIYIIRADLIKKGDRYGKKIGRKIISRQENVDIDDKFDFWLAEKILLEQDKYHK